MPGQLSVADLFCGAGGLSRGLADAGMRVAAAADHDPDACSTYRLNFPDTVLVEGDIGDPRCRLDLIDAAGAVDLDVLAGGPPCQAFSQVRNHDRLIDDPRNRLYREFVRALAELQPRALVLENVLGMNQLKGGAVRRQIEEDLALSGLYKVISGVLDAGDFGVPQRRPRLVFIGFRADLGVSPALPEGTGIAKPFATGTAVSRARPSVRPRPSPSAARPWDDRVVSASQALSDLIEPGEVYTSPPESAFQAKARAHSRSPQDHLPSRIREDTRRRLEAIPPGGNVYDLPEELLARYLGDSKWGPAGNGTRSARRHYYAYRRLHPDWLAWTTNTKADFAYHYAVPRGLSVREAARIQGFRDDFHFITAPPGTPGQLRNGARHSRYRQVGNAVPPPLAAAIGTALAEVLGQGSPSLVSGAASR